MADVTLDPFNLEVDFKIWFEKISIGESHSLIGEKKIELLVAIHKLGSIKAAAEECNLDFKVAWDMISSANERFDPYDLVVSTRGRGGGSYLSPLGLEILQQYDRMNSIIRLLLPTLQDGFIANVVDISEESGNNNTIDLQMKLQHNQIENTNGNNFSEKVQNYKKVFVIPIND